MGNSKLRRDGSRAQFILGSGSPRREDLLKAAGYTFTREPPRTRELIVPGEEPIVAAVRLAIEKALDVLGRSSLGSVVLAADTIVVCGRRIYGKPRDTAHAADMLMSLAGRNHDVITGWAILQRHETTGSLQSIVASCRSVVRMREVPQREARLYAAGGEPLDKAGGYAVQGEGKRFIGAILGPVDNVIGLPVCHVVRGLGRFGIHLRDPIT